MKSILVHIEVDHEVRTRSAIDQAIRVYRQEPCTVYLLHVQPAVSGHVAMYFGSAELKDLLATFGTEDMKLAESLLDAAKIPYTTLVRIGRTASTIANVAKELGCGRIIFGVEEPGLAERLLGSLAHQVRHLLQSQGDPQVLGS